MMYADQVQPFIKSCLEAHPSIAEAGGADLIIEDDGSYPDHPRQNEILDGNGLCLIIWRVQAGGLVEALKTGPFLQTFDLAVVIEELDTINQGEAGTKIPAERMLSCVQQALCAQAPAETPKPRLQPGDPPFEHFGKVGGRKRIAVYFTLLNEVNPA